MIRVAFLYLPQEDQYKVKIDDQDTGFFLKKNPRNERWFIVKPDGDTLKQEPHSREAASLLAAFFHFEQERRQLEADEPDEEETEDGSS